MDSPFKDFLYTNTVPSDAECQRIRDLLVGPRQQIEDLTDEIIGTQLLLDGLSRQRAALRESVAAHFALVSPVRRLPLDILEEIFIACLPTDHNSVMAESDAPLLLCHICSTWRSLALSTPQLWASLHISTLLSEPRMSSMIDAAYGWLSRSGVAPLSISVSAARIYDSDLTKLLATLQSFSLRWEHIRLRLPGFRYYGLLASLSPGDVPILRSVVLTGPGRGTGNTEWSRLGFLGSRSLHSASISVSDPDPLSLPLRWKGLRRLCLQPNSYITPEQALTILEKCPFLETISTIINGGSAIWQTGPISTSETVYHMEHLRNLYVMNHARGPNIFFNHLVTPQLTCLEYSGLGPQVPLNGILSSSLLDTLSLVPTLRCLQLRGEPSDPQFITSLNRTDYGDILCPNLECIVLLRFRETPDQALLDFIQARVGLRMKRLLHVRAHFDRTMQIDILPPLQSMISDGFAISLEYAVEPAPLRYSPSEGLLRNGAEWAPISQSEWWNAR